MVQIDGCIIPELEFEDSFNRISKQFIESKAKELRMQVPSGYIELLTQFNGGRPNKKEFIVQARGVRAFIYLLCIDQYGFTPFEDADLYSVSWRTNKFGDYVPANYLNIGVVTRDDLLVVNLLNGSVGMIEWSDVCERPRRVGQSDVIPIADSIRLFLSNLEFYIQD